MAVGCGETKILSLEHSFETLYADSQIMTRYIPVKIVLNQPTGDRKCLMLPAVMEKQTQGWHIS